MSKPNVVSFPGVNVYVGAPRTGKTFAALYEAGLLCEQLEVPLLLVEGVRQESYPSVLPTPARFEPDESFPDCWLQLARLLSERRFVAVMIEDGAQLDRMLTTLMECGSLALVLDESASWVTSRSWPKMLSRLLRAYRHLRWSFSLTTQAFAGDVPNFLVSCEPRLCAFRVADANTLKRLGQHHPAEDLKTLPDRAFVEIDLAASVATSARKPPPNPHEDSSK